MKQNQEHNPKLDELHVEGKKLSIKQMINVRGGAGGSRPGRWT